MGKQRLRTTFATFAGLTALGLLGLAACGGNATSPVKGPGTEKTAVYAPKTNLDIAAEEPVEKTPDEVMPSQIGSLFQFVAKDAPLIVNIPKLDKLLAALDNEAREAITKEISESLAKKATVDGDLFKDLLNSFQGAVIFSDPAKKNASTEEAAEATCIAARFSDAKGVETLLANKAIERMGKTRFQIVDENNKKSIQGAWLADSGVLLTCLSQDVFSSAVAVANGAKPSFSSSPLFAPERANDFFVTVDLNPIVGNKVEPGSRFYAGLVTQNNGISLDLRLSAYGPDFPPIGSVIDAAPQSLVGKMPKGTVGALGFSLKRMAGKNINDIFALADRAGNNRTLEQAEMALYQLGFNMNDIDAALGDEVAIGIYRDPKFKVSFEKDKDLAHTVVIVAIGTKDEATQKKLWATITTLAKNKDNKDKKNKELTIKGDVIESSGAKDKKLLRIESRKGMLLFGGGDKTLVKEALAKVGKDKETLGANPAFLDARAHEKPTMHALAYLDGAVLKALLDTKATDTKLSGSPAFLALLLGPTDRGLELSLGGNGAMELISTVSSIAIAGVKQYTAEAKASDAKMNVRFIARYAQRAYERESVDEKGKPTHKLCKTALPVPTTIPKATTYKTTFSSGGDWDSGDDSTGWKCLQFFMGETTRYQFEYRQGNDYKGPKRGGPNPGKDGFEVSAEGDLDGDGKTSLFTITGKITAGKLTLDKDLFESDPTE